MILTSIVIYIVKRVGKAVEKMMVELSEMGVNIYITL